MDDRFRDVVMVLTLALGAYGVWKVGPVVVDRWVFQQVIRNYVQESSKGLKPRSIEAGIRERLARRGLDSQDVELRIEAPQTPNGRLRHLEVRGWYRPVIHHPIINRVTSLEFESVRRKVFTFEW